MATLRPLAPDASGVPKTIAAPDTISLDVLPGVPLYIGPTQPTLPAGQKYLWIETGIGDGSDFSIWFDDGS